MDLKPYEEMKQEYENLRTFKLIGGRPYNNNITSEEIIFAEQFGMDTEQPESMIYKPVVEYLNNARITTNMTVNTCNQVLGKIGIASHYLNNFQHRPITEDAYNKLREHMDLKPYEEIKQEDEALRRTYNLRADRPYNNTWNFKQTPTKKEDIHAKSQNN